MNILVTGGSRGIGKEIVDYFNNLNHRVFYIYKNNNLYLNNGISFKCDINDSEKIIEIINKILQNYNIDVLINNAGIIKDSTFIKMNEDNWNHVIDTNLKSIFTITQCCLKNMIKNNFWNIINITSIIGQYGGFGQTNYAASKAGIIGFTKALAMETAKTNIRVNAISAGYIYTDMIKNLNDNIKEKLLKKIPLGYFGKPIDIVKTIEFLLNSNYIHGEIINVDGGI
jgi:acetoacetyl-CoA reductase